MVDSEVAKERMKGLKSRWGLLPHRLTTGNCRSENADLGKAEDLSQRSGKAEDNIVRRLADKTTSRNIYLSESISAFLEASKSTCSGCYGSKSLRLTLGGRSEGNTPQGR
jgi:hypothetical protein